MYKYTIPRIPERAVVYLIPLMMRAVCLTFLADPVLIFVHKAESPSTNGKQYSPWMQTTQSQYEHHLQPVIQAATFGPRFVLRGTFKVGVWKEELKTTLWICQAIVLLSRNAMPHLAFNLFVSFKKDA